MFKVKTALDAKSYDAARKTLKAVADKLPADSDLKPEVAATGLLITLRDPATKPADAAKAVADAAPLLGKVTPVLRAMLCEAAEALALSSQPALLDATIQLTTKARDVDPVDKPMQERLAKLLAARLVQRAAQPTAPTSQELPQLLQDFEQIENAGLNNSTVDAFHAECLLAQSSPNRQELTALMERIKAADPYTQYVQARVLAHRLSARVDEIASLLMTAYADPAKPDALLTPTYRRAEAAKLLVEAAMSKRNSSAVTAATVLANPFPDEKTAAEVFQWLRVARSISEGINLDLKRNKLDLRINWTLSAVWKPKPAEFADGEIARLAKMSNAELGSDVFPILNVAFRTHGTEPAEQATAIQSAQRIVELFQKQFPVADPQAAKLYTDLIQPALARLMAWRPASRLRPISTSFTPPSRSLSVTISVSPNGPSPTSKPKSKS